jgi:hypothetical protein
MDTAAGVVDRLPLPFNIDEVLVWQAGAPGLFVGRAHDGRPWLVAQVAARARDRRWLCAPASDRAIACLFSGRAAPGDLFRHSVTGTIDDIMVDAQGRVYERTRLCSDVNRSEIPFAVIGVKPPEWREAL